MTPEDLFKQLQEYIDQQNSELFRNTLLAVPQKERSEFILSTFGINLFNSADLNCKNIALIIHDSLPNEDIDLQREFFLRASPHINQMNRVLGNIITYGSEALLEREMERIASEDYLVDEKIVRNTPKIISGRQELQKRIDSKEVRMALRNAVEIDRSYIIPTLLNGLENEDERNLLTKNLINHFVLKEKGARTVKVILESLESPARKDFILSNHGKETYQIMFDSEHDAQDVLLKYLNEDEKQVMDDSLDVSSISSSDTSELLGEKITPENSPKTLPTISKSTSNEKNIGHSV